MAPSARGSPTQERLEQQEAVETQGAHATGHIAMDSCVAFDVENGSRHSSRGGSRASRVVCKGVLHAACTGFPSRLLQHSSVHAMLLLCCVQAGPHRSSRSGEQADSRFAAPDSQRPPEWVVSDEERQLQRRIRFGMNASWAVNILLLIAKIAAFALSLSMSLLASTTDSVIDLLSQGFIALAERNAGRWDPRFPTGRSRLETVAVLGCAAIMVTGTVLVIRECVDVLLKGWAHGNLPDLFVGPIMYSILGAGTASKLWLWLYCRRMASRSPSMLALATDHWNDILSNVGAVIGPTIAFYVPKVWWLDAVGGILISLYILYNWWGICTEQVNQIVGMAAPPEFLEEVKEMVAAHNPGMELDRVLAYHVGHRYIVEVEVVMHHDTRLEVVHDVAIALQHKIEALDMCERAYVHVDWSKRDYFEHKVERTLLSKAATDDAGEPRQPGTAVVAASA